MRADHRARDGWRAPCRRRFKVENSEQLHNLRVHLNGKLADLVLIQDQTVRSAKIAEAQREIDESVKRLQEKMRHRRWPIVLGGAAALASRSLVPPLLWSLAEPPWLSDLDWDPLSAVSAVLPSAYNARRGLI